MLLGIPPCGAVIGKVTLWLCDGICESVKVWFATAQPLVAKLLLRAVVKLFEPPWLPPDEPLTTLKALLLLLVSGQKLP